MNKKRIILIAIVLILIGVILWFMFGRTKKYKITYETVEVTRGDISISITATGTIEPITQVEVGTQVSGIVDRIYVDYNSPVTKGQVIAELDKTNLLNELASQESSVATAKAEFDYQQAYYNRYKTLYDKELISANDFELAYYNYQQSKNAYDISVNNLAKAKTNLGYATIYSPIDGVVLSKEVEEGQTVAASFNTPTLFTIAQDLTQMQVVANIDEADIGQVKEGQRVEFNVDAYPNDLFIGDVTQVRQEAIIESNVVTYEVIINSPNPDLKLKPGLTANVTIYTEERNNVLSVPAKAFRFVPESPLIGPEDEVIDAEGRNKLWTREEKTFIAHPVEIGLTNGIHTEILSGIAEGTYVIQDAVIGQMPGETAKPENNSTETNPFMPARPGGRR